MSRESPGCEVGDVLVLNWCIRNHSRIGGFRQPCDVRSGWSTGWAVLSVLFGFSSSVQLH